MKKPLFFGFCGGLALTFAVATSSFAQYSVSKVSNVIDANFNMEYTLEGVNHISNGKEITADMVSPKAIKSFNKSFKNTTPSWYALNKSYLATFDKNGMKSRAVLTKGGYILYTISYGKENNLPKDVRKTIKSNYIDHNIGTVSEVTSAKRTAWVVNLQDDKELVLARVLDDGSLDEMQHFSTVPPQPKTHRRGRVIIPQ